MSTAIPQPKRPGPPPITQEMRDKMAANSQPQQLPIPPAPTTPLRSGAPQVLAGAHRLPVPAAPTTPLRQPPAAGPARWKDEKIGVASVGAVLPAEELEPEVGSPRLGVAGGIGLDEGEDPALTSARSHVRSLTSEQVDGAGGAPVGKSWALTRDDARGLAYSQSGSTETASGGTIKNTNYSVEGMAGARAKLEALASYSPKQIEVAVEALAQAGAFGEATKAISLRKGNGQVNASGQASFGAGVQASLKGNAAIDRSIPYLPQVSAAIDAAIRAGVWAEASGRAGAKLAPSSVLGELGVEIAGQISAFAGLEAKFSGQIFASVKDGVNAEFSASARAGAGAEASGDATVNVGPMSVSLGGSAAVFAGAEAKAKGGISLSLTGVKVEFEASAFAGARAEASGRAGFKIRGREVLSIKGTVEALAGVGGRIGTSFKAGANVSGDGSGSTHSKTENDSGSNKTMDQIERDERTEKWNEELANPKGPFHIQKDGSIRFGAALGGALGVGVGAKFEASLDYITLGEAIAGTIGESMRSSSKKAQDKLAPDFKRESLTTDSALAKRVKSKTYDEVFPLFRDYAITKATSGKNGVKRENVQELINLRLPELRPYLSYLEADEGLTEAAKNAFAGQVADVEIKGGRISKWIDVSDQSLLDFKERIAREEKWAKVRDGLRDEFVAYAAKKERKGTEGVKRARIQEIIDKRWKEIRRVFGPDACELVSFVAELSRINAFFDSGKVRVDDQGQLLEGPSSVGDVVYVEDNSPAAIAAMAGGAAGGVPTTSVLKTGMSKAAQIKADFATATSAREANAELAKLDTELTTYLSKARRGGPFTVNDIFAIIRKQTGKIDLNLPGATSTVSELVSQTLGETASGVMFTGDRLVINLHPEKLQQMTNDPDTAAAKVKVTSELRGYLQKKFREDASPLKAETVNSHVKSGTSKISALRDSGARDALITAWIEEALAPVGPTVVVSKGVVQSLSTSNFAAAKAAALQVAATEKADTRTLPGSSEFDNHRRSMVMERIRGPLEDYRVAFMTKFMADPLNTKLDQAKLQAIISRVDSIKSDVSPVADDQIKEALVKSFPMINASQTTVTDLQLSLTQIMVLRTDEIAMTEIRRELAAGGIVDKASVLQTIVARHLVRFSSKGAELDAAIESAIRGHFFQQVGPQIVELVVKNGKVTKFKLESKGSGWSFGRIIDRITG